MIALAGLISSPLYANPTPATTVNDVVNQVLNAPECINAPLTGGDSHSDNLNGTCINALSVELTDSGFSHVQTSGLVGTHNVQAGGARYELTITTNPDGTRDVTSVINSGLSASDYVTSIVQTETEGATTSTYSSWVCTGAGNEQRTRTDTTPITTVVTEVRLSGLQTEISRNETDRVTSQVETRESTEGAGVEANYREVSQTVEPINGGAQLRITVNFTYDLVYNHNSTCAGESRTTTGHTGSYTIIEDANPDDPVQFGYNNGQLTRRVLDVTTEVVCGNWGDADGDGIQERACDTYTITRYLTE